MHAIRKTNVDGVDSRLVQEFVVGSVRLGDVILLGELLGLLDIAGSDGGDDDAAVALCRVDDGGRVDGCGGEDADAESVGLLCYGVV